MKNPLPFEGEKLEELYGDTQVLHEKPPEASPRKHSNRKYLGDEQYCMEIITIYSLVACLSKSK